MVLEQKQREQHKAQRSKEMSRQSVLKEFRRDIIFAESSGKFFASKKFGLPADNPGFCNDIYNFVKSEFEPKGYRVEITETKDKGCDMDKILYGSSALFRVYVRW